MRGQVAQCVANSLGWYDAVLQAHGVAGAITGGVWACREKVPPYYSNAVTADTSDAVVQLRVLRDLEAEIGRPFSVKDSFGVLDLAALGMRPLFDAEWIWRDPSSGAPEDERTDVEWRRVSDDAELERWEAAWRDSGSPADTRVFLPQLLASGEIALFAGRRGDRIVAGCAANRCAGAIGFSNFFGQDADRAALMASAVGATMRFAPGVPVVGYAAGEDLASATRLGFQAVGPLRVWLAG